MKDAENPDRELPAERPRLIDTLREKLLRAGQESPREPVPHEVLVARLQPYMPPDEERELELVDSAVPVASEEVEVQEPEPELEPPRRRPRPVEARPEPPAAEPAAREEPVQVPEPVAAEEAEAPAPPQSESASPSPDREPEPKPPPKPRRRRRKVEAEATPEPRAPEPAAREEPVPEPEQPPSGDEPSRRLAQPRAQTPPPRPRPRRRSRPRAARREMPNVLRCEIKLWRGYLKCQLYAEAAAGESVLATSPYFRLKDPNTPTEEAEGHLAELIEALEKRGWQLTASGATWYRHRLEKLQQPNELD